MRCRLYLSSPPLVLFSQVVSICINANVTRAVFFRASGGGERGIGFILCFPSRRGGGRVEPRPVRASIVLGLLDVLAETVLFYVMGSCVGRLRLCEVRGANAPSP